MNRFSIAAAVAATACIIGIPTVAALASDGSTNTRGPSSSQVDDRSGPNRGSDDVTHSPSAVPTSGASIEPGDDHGTNTEPGDDHGTSVEPGDDHGTSVEPGDDRGTSVERGDDNGGHHGHGG
jgi:hypothetical protein